MKAEEFQYYQIVHHNYHGCRIAVKFMKRSVPFVSIYEIRGLAIMDQVTLFATTIFELNPVLWCKVYLLILMSFVSESHPAVLKFNIFSDSQGFVPKVLIPQLSKTDPPLVPLMPWMYIGLEHVTILQSERFGTSHGL